MTLRFLTVALTVGLAFQAAAASAATPIDQKRPLAADGRIRVSNISGRIVVSTWDKPQVHITGSLGEGVEKLAIEGDEKYLRIEVRYPEHQGGFFGFGKRVNIEPSIVQVLVPRGASVALEAVSADVEVAGVHGKRLEIDAVSGNVKVSDSTPGTARFENVRGDLDLLLNSPTVNADTVSGDLTLRGALTGEVEVESVSGNIIVASTRLRRLEASTVSGDADLRVGIDAGGSLSADSVSGTINIVLPKGSGAKLRAETFSGDIRSPVGHVDEEEHGPGKSLEARIGDGRADIDLESFSGDIRVSMP
jgi:DUF4097 and DUF4098 domain-containing protein YvlB